MSSRAGADFHQVQINQLMAGALGDDDIEFIEIKMLGSRQICQGGGFATGGGFNCVAPSPTNGAKLVFFDADGSTTGEFLFPDNTPMSLSQKSELAMGMSSGVASKRDQLGGY